MISKIKCSPKCFREMILSSTNVYAVSTYQQKERENIAISTKVNFKLYEICKRFLRNNWE